MTASYHLARVETVRAERDRLASALESALQKEVLAKDDLERRVFEQSRAAEIYADRPSPDTSAALLIAREAATLAGSTLTVCSKRASEARDALDTAESVLAGAVAEHEQAAKARRIAELLPQASVDRIYEDAAGRAHRINDLFGRIRHELAGLGEVYDSVNKASAALRHEGEPIADASPAHLLFALAATDPKATASAVFDGFLNFVQLAEWREQHPEAPTDAWLEAILSRAPGNLGDRIFAHGSAYHRHDVQAVRERFAIQRSARTLREMGAAVSNANHTISQLR